MMRRSFLLPSIVVLLGCRGNGDARVGKIAADSVGVHMASAYSNLIALSDSLRKGFTARLQSEVDSLALVVFQRRAEVLALEEARQRTIRGLPGVVTLDSLNSYYASRWKEPSFAESFDTRAGSLTFSKADFTFAYLRSPRDIAFIRIGRERDAGTSREVIQAWLRESAEAKQRQGYQRVYVRSGPAEYGEYNESMYRKGDAYLKTFFRFSRVQGTYDRFSLEYDYFVEIGSTARADRYKDEQYAARIGS